MFGDAVGGLVAVGLSVGTSVGVTMQIRREGGGYEKTKHRSKMKHVNAITHSPVGRSVGEADGLSVAVGDVVGRLKMDIRDNTSFSWSVISSAESQL